MRDGARGMNPFRGHLIRRVGLGDGVRRPLGAAPETLDASPAVATPLAERWAGWLVSRRTRPCAAPQARSAARGCRRGASIRQGSALDALDELPGARVDLHPV